MDVSEYLIYLYEQLYEIVSNTKLKYVRPESKNLTIKDLIKSRKCYLTANGIILRNKAIQTKRSLGGACYRYLLTKNLDEVIKLKFSGDYIDDINLEIPFKLKTDDVIWLSLYTCKTLLNNLADEAKDDG